MRRYHSVIEQNLIEKRVQLHKYDAHERDSDTTSRSIGPYCPCCGWLWKGRWRKRKVGDCGKSKCTGCHSDKIFKRATRRTIDAQKKLIEGAASLHKVPSYVGNLRFPRKQSRW